MGNCSSTAIAPIDDSSVEAHDHQAVRVAAPEADDSSLKETENDDYLPDNAASYPKAIHPEASSIKLVDELLQEEELKSTWKGAEPHTWPHTMSSSPNMASKTAQVPSIQAGPSKEEPEKIVSARADEAPHSG